MLQNRVIPILLYRRKGLYKTTQFKKPKYVGDPLNAIKIFNDKEVDELMFLDIEASKQNKEPEYKLIEDIASECFMPLGYGGGIKTLDQVKRIFSLGIEKISINHNSFKDLALIEKAAKHFGSQSIVASIDIKKSLFGKYEIFDHTKGKIIKKNLFNMIQELQNAGAGELLITSVDREGTMQGYDLKLLSMINEKSKVPVIANGGAGNLNHFKEVKEKSKVSAMAAGSFFVFQGKHKAVLISYPKYEELKKILNQ